MKLATLPIVFFTKKHTRNGGVCAMTENRTELDLLKAVTGNNRKNKVMMMMMIMIEYQYE